jgi:hypothetical protein
MSKYYIGQKFLTKKGDYAILERIQGNYLYLRYKNKIHKRHKRIIGEKLYLNKEHFRKNNRIIVETKYADGRIDKSIVEPKIGSEQDYKKKKDKKLDKDIKDLNKKTEIKKIDPEKEKLKKKIIERQKNMYEAMRIANNKKNKNKTNKYKKSCKNCKYSVRGECLGDGLCDDYVHVPTMTDEDRKNYPKEGDASYMRRTGFSRNR